MAQQKREDVPAGSPRRGAVERLYVYWLISTVLLVLIVVVLALFVRSGVRTAREAERDVSVLRPRVAQLEQDVMVLRELLSNARADDSQSPDAATEEPALEPTAMPATQPVSSDGRATLPAGPAAPTEEEVQARLASLLATDPVRVTIVDDQRGARQLVQEMLRYLHSAEWSGVLWERLAALARLVDQQVAAEAYARRATAAGAPLLTYSRVAARHLLQTGNANDALFFARQLVERSDAAPRALVVLAEALLAIGDRPAAGQALRSIDDLSELSLLDRMRLARVALQLEEWDNFHALVDTLQDVPEELLPEFNFLTAVALSRDGQSVEALAILDHLAAHPQPQHDAPPALEPVPRPGTYEVLVWRGVALLGTDQYEAARQALDRAAAANPGRPEAYYYRAVMEARAGERETAIAYLKNALACSARMVPAWETLALLEIDAGRIDPALEHLTRVVELDPNRASAHFLRAVAHAKLSDAEAATTALRRAFELNEALVDEAVQTDVLTRLLSVEQIESLAESAPASATQ